MNVAKEIIKRAFDQGLIVLVDDGDGSKIAYGSLGEAWAAIEAVEEADVFVRMPGAENAEEWMKVIPHGVAEDETVCNCTADGWIDALHHDLIF
ncbi:hypothetical protein [Ancylobacter rudongensis]|uniref:Uncharacterized protein n=1 Tax=Ancylobacter rudongensis TaxID=177413 RepID=A0A1G4UPH3_9HYPH|nr:hypothetical protein [Ancylobacter rudongensis]SCW95467.1 hypothetical protein SAMN05660859_0035 [Ancylobacter rudongensis]